VIKFQVFSVLSFETVSAILPLGCIDISFTPDLQSQQSEKLLEQVIFKTFIKVPI
jgi:hypothetical protein